MTREMKRRLTSLLLASSLFAGTATLSGCSGKEQTALNEEVSNFASPSSSDTIRDKGKTEPVEPTLKGKNDGKLETEEIGQENEKPAYSDEPDNGVDDMALPTLSQTPQKVVLPTPTEVSGLIDPSTIGFNVKNEYSNQELYVIDASLLDESLKGKSYITTTDYFSMTNGDVNYIFVCYPSVNSDFVLVHQIAFVNNEFMNVTYYSNLSGGISSDSNDMNTIISNSMIRPLSEITDAPVLSLEEVQALVAKINDENRLVLD